MKIQKILEAVKEISAMGSGAFGFGYLDLQTGETCCQNGDMRFPTASVFKIFVLIELYRQIEAGRFPETKTLRATPENAALGSGALKRMRHGAELSLHDHAVLMMMLSDNTSSDLLFDLVGEDNISEHIIRSLGLEDTRIEIGCTEMIQLSRQTQERYMGDFFLCRTEKTDCTTPREMLKLLRALYGEAFLSHEYNERVLGLMKPHPQYNRLEKYLPCGTRVARKTGSLDRLANDVGIIFTERGPYVVAAFYNGNTASREEYDREDKRHLAEELIARVSQAVYRLHTET